MPHPFVTQLRFARSELRRCLGGVSEEEGRHRLKPMNSISWIVGHLTDQEHSYWVLIAQDQQLAPELGHLVGYGQPASTPSLEEMWVVWHKVTAAADKYLDTLTADTLQTHLTWQGQRRAESIGTMLQRNIYHYWFHTGEAHAIRQQLGHQNLPQFVGDMSKAIYQPEVPSQ